MKRTESYNANRGIKRAAEKTVRNSDIKSILALASKITSRIECDGVVPALIESRVVLAFDPDITAAEVFGPDDVTSIPFARMIDEDGRIWLPLFTDLREIKSKAPSDTITSIPIRSLIECALADERVAGIMINPFGVRLALTDYLLQMILDMV